MHFQHGFPLVFMMSLTQTKKLFNGAFFDICCLWAKQIRRLHLIVLTVVAMFVIHAFVSYRISLDLSCLLLIYCQAKKQKCVDKMFKMTELKKKIERKMKNKGKTDQVLGLLMHRCWSYSTWQVLWYVKYYMISSF